MPIRQQKTKHTQHIAAGEVVERPASVVKELIENSIDAGATQIRVDLTGGGLQLIRITDNGSGIPVEELPLALARHATSKVSQVADLEHIISLGFRGEALASIAAVADVMLVSRYRGAEQGAQISATNGQISEVNAAASPEGTTLTVRNLFSAVPARLKFLKSRNTEVSHCHHLLEQYALAYPEIRFSVFSEGRQIFATTGDGQLSNVLVEIYGLQVAEQMIPMSSLDGNDDDPERPVVSGYVSRPTCYKSTRQHISFFVNRRWVLSRMLTAAVEEAYHSLLLAGRHPIAVVNIQVDPALLDVNVHPAKTEIRFLKERRVFAAILRAVRRALLEEPQMPRWGQGNAAMPASTRLSTVEKNTAQHTTVSSSLPDDELESEDDELAQLLEPESAPALTPEATEEIVFPQDNPWLTVTEEEAGTKPPLLSRLWQSHVRKSEPDSGSVMPASPTAPAPTTTMAFQRIRQTPAPGIPLSASAPVEHIQGEKQLLFGSNAQEESILASAHARHLPALRVIGQLSQSYIVTEGPDGMYLVDQHAAHERILLERMVAALKASTPISQLLLTPIKIAPAPQELEAIEEHMQQLQSIGFTIEIQDATIEVKAVPAVLLKQMNARSLHELLTDLTVADNQGHSETWEEHALANIACKAAIKANYFLTVSEMREMLEQLEQTDAPYSCCHGRPTMVHFSLSALDQEFGRR